MDVDTAEKYQKNIKSENEKTTSQARRAAVASFETDLITNPSNPALGGKIKTMSRGDIKSLNKDSIKTISGNRELLKQMNLSSVIQLLNHNELEDSDLSVVLNEFENIKTSTLPLMSANDPEYKRLKQMTDMLTDPASVAGILSRRT